MRSKAFFINGGAGRVICSIPAFEKYAETHEDFIIVCEGGTDFFKGHPILHNKVYDNWHKGLFEDQLIHRDLISPEPYRNWHYYNQKCSLSQAFDIIINDLDDPRELPDPTLNLTKMEVCTAQNILKEIKSGTGKDKVVIIQPFGRSVQSLEDFIVDPTSRSMNLVNTIDIINDLKKDYSIIIMSEIHFPLEENEDKSKYKVARPQIEDVRLWAALIEGADHFIGCDSVGQHIAKAVGTTATIIIGSTFPINISYPNFSGFDIIDIGDGKRKYDPIRVSIDDERTRFNDQSCEMSKEKVKMVIESARKRLGKSVEYKRPQIEPKKPDSSTNNNSGYPIVPSQLPSLKPQKLEIPNSILSSASKTKVSKGFKEEVENLLKSTK